MKFEKRLTSKYLIILAHIGALLSSVFWATSFLSTKVLMENGGFTPVELFVYRFALAYIFLLLITFKKIKSNNWKDELTFLVSGICAGSLYFITENYALKMTTTGNVSLLVSTAPLITTFLMALFFKQRVKMGVMIGSMFAIVGVGLIIFSHGDSLEIRPEGDLLALAASVCWSIYTVAVRRVIPNYTSLVITRKLFFYGVVTALPLLLMQREPYHIDLIFKFNNLQYIFNFLFLVLMCSVIAYVLWNAVLRILGAERTSNYLYLQPIMTMIAGYIFLGETILLMGYIGCILVIIGLIVSDKWKGSIWFKKK